MVPLQEQISLSIAHHRLFFPRQRILVAVSGGIDSMVLLDILARLSIGSGWKLTIAHLNHQLRGRSSMADERLVLCTAEQLGLPMVISRADVRGFARAHNLSIEMGARKLRHEFLARTAKERKIPSIALAHHLDDQIELFFLRLFRGAGSQGLAGMKWSSPSPENAAIKLVRPLLDHPKSVLEDYALQNKIAFRADATNACLEIPRNRIRHRLLPLLKKSYQPALNETISRFMEILSAESELVNKLAESWVRANADKTLGKRPVASLDPLSSGVAANFSRRPFADLPVALQRRCVQIQLVWKGIAAGYELVEHLRLHPGVPIEVSAQRMNPAAVLPETGGDQAKSSGFRVEREAGGLVHESHSKSLVFSDECRQLDLGTGNGRLAWDGVEFAWQIFANKGLSKLKKTPGRELFDADLVGSTVILRHWLPGDRFQPIGMERAIKLQDLFVNQKVPQERRRRLTVGSTAAGDLFWVEGLRISERFKLTRATIRSLHWAWQRL